MEIQKLAQISEKVFDGYSSLDPQENTVLLGMLKQETISYGKIRTFSLEDSQEVVLLTLKQNVLLLLQYLSKGQIKIADELLDAAFSLIELQPRTTGGSTDLHAQIEKEKLVRSIQMLIVDLVFKTQHCSSSILTYLKNKKMPDDISVNLVVAVDQQLDLQSFELTVLSKKILGPVLLNLTKSYRNVLLPEAKKKIVDAVIPFISTSEKNTVYEIFRTINEERHLELLSAAKQESSPEFYGFASSLVTDKAAAEAVYNRLQTDFVTFESALKTLLSFSQAENKQLLPRDQQIFEALLLCINKISSFNCYNFFRFVSLFQGVLKIRTSRRIKGLIYEILCKYIQEKDLYVPRVVQCRDEVEEELRSRDFFLLPRLIRFLNAYQKREASESQLITAGQSMGSPYVTSESASHLHDFRLLGLKSEDPCTVIECFSSFIPLDIVRLNSAHVRKAMTTDTAVIERVVLFQLEHRCVIDDISIINTIISHPSDRFFEYASLFDDFSFYLNGDVLERISDDLQKGIAWINRCYNRDFGLFVMRNNEYFNELLRANPHVQKELLLIYEKVLDENLSDVLFFVGSCERRGEESRMHSIFYLLDSPELLTAEFFSIFAKQLVYRKFYMLESHLERYTIKRYSTAFYECFIKAKAVCKLDVSSDIQFMMSSLLVTEDLLGYLKIAGLYVPENEGTTDNVLLNFNVKDNALFLRSFPKENEFGRFILFFSLQFINKEIDALIKDEIMRNLKNTNKVYLRMCVLQLFKTREIDQLLKILEKNFDDKELLFKLSMHGITTGGRYFSKEIFDYGTEEMKAKALFLLYYQNIWEKEYLQELISKVDPNMYEETRYILEDMKKY